MEQTQQDKNKEPQKPEAKKPDAKATIKLDQNTVFLCPDGYEGDAAMHWLMRTFPDIEHGMDELLRAELDVAQLSRYSTVYVLLRKRKSQRIPLTNAQPWEQAPDGQRVTVEMPLDKMVDEVQPYGPINCSEFFYTTGEKWQAPRLDIPRFIEALGKAAAPWSVDSTEKAELKNGQRPTRFKLLFC